MKRAPDSPSFGAMTRAVVASGLVNQDQLDEMKRWSSTLDPEAVVGDPKPLKETIGLIAEALQSEGYVLFRETDLEILQRYAATMARGVLHLETPDDSAEVEVTYGQTQLGEYIIAWYDGDIKDTLVNGQTYLRVGNKCVFFKDVRELFFGEQKAFVVCIPSVVEHVE